MADRADQAVLTTGSNPASAWRRCSNSPGEEFRSVGWVPSQAKADPVAEAAPRLTPAPAPDRVRRLGLRL
jgi:hypothetical protein